MKTNMKAAMQYQNKTPEEIVRQYKKRLRAKQGLLILILLLYVIVGIRGIWWGDDGIADVLLKLLDRKSVVEGQSGVGGGGGWGV